VTNLSRELWLTDSHRRLILDKFGPKSTRRIPEVVIASNALSDLLLPTLTEDENILPQFLSSLLKVEGTTKEVAAALASLEYELRRKDPLGECVRWLAKGRRRDLLSFPERVSVDTFRVFAGQ
jgi:hypothetical protein